MYPPDVEFLTVAVYPVGVSTYYDDFDLRLMEFPFTILESHDQL